MNSNESVIHESIYELNSSGLKNTRDRWFSKAKLHPWIYIQKKPMNLIFPKLPTPPPNPYNKNHPSSPGLRKNGETRPQTASKMLENKTLLEETYLERKSKLPPGDHNSQFIQYYE